MDEDPIILLQKGSVVSFLRFIKDRAGAIVDVERLEGTIMEVCPNLPEPYIVGMYRDNGEYWETYADTKHTKLIVGRLPPLENGPKKKSPYVEFKDEDFRS